MIFARINIKNDILSKMSDFGVFFKDFHYILLSEIIIINKII